jgi:hypothetical protein
MTNFIMRDAADFTPAMLSGAQAVSGYIGGEEADHVWSDADWAATGAMPKLPIWVPLSNETVSEGRAEGLEILSTIYHYHIPRGQTIAFDLELSDADLGYVQAAAGVLQYFGYGAMAYGSLSTIQKAAPPYLWKWDADWTGLAHLTPGFQATQWANGPNYDISEISQELYSTLVWR